MRNLIWKHKFAFAAVTAAVAVSALAELAQPFWLKQIIDRSLIGGDFSALPFFAALFFLSALLAQTVHFFEMALVERLSTKICGEIRENLWKCLASAPLKESSKRPSGAWMSYFTEDIAAVQDYFVEGIASLANQGVYLLGIFVCVLILDWRMLPVFLMAPLLFLATLPLKRAYLKSCREALESQERLNGFLDEIPKGLREIRQFRMAPALEDEASEKMAAHKKALLKQSRIAVLFPAVMESLGWMITGTALAFGGYQVLRGNLSVGTLVMFLEYSRRVFAPLYEMAGRWNRFQSSAAALGRISKSVDSRQSAPGSESQFPGFDEAIRFDNVSFGYTQGSRIYNRLNFTVRKGEKIAVRGPSGAGKSTLIRLLLRLYEPDEGAVFTDGIETKFWDAKSLRRKMLWISGDTGDADFEAELKEKSRFSLILLDEAEKRLDAFRTEALLDSVLSDPEMTVIWISHREQILNSFPRVIHLNQGVLVDDVKGVRPLARGLTPFI